MATKKKKTAKKKSSKKATRNPSAKKAAAGKKAAKTAKKRKRGRPALPPGQARSEVFCIRLTSGELQKIEAAAASKGMTSRRFAVAKLMRGL